MIQVLNNDINGAGNVSTAGLSITSVSVCTNGGTAFMSDGGTTVTYYVPSSSFLGTDTFTYTIQDSTFFGDGPSTATVTVTVVPQLLTGAINGLAENIQYTWGDGDGINDLATQWSRGFAPGCAGPIYIYASGYGWGLDFYVATGLTDPTTIQDAAGFTYDTGLSTGTATKGDTVFFRGSNGYYGAWRIDDVYPFDPFLLYGQWYFQSAGTGNFFSPIGVTPIYLDFGYVPVGSMKDLTLTIRNRGSEILTGTATTADPFGVVSGGSYNLNPDGSQIVTVRYMPTSLGSHNGTMMLTGGDGTIVRVIGVAVPFGTAVINPDPDSINAPLDADGTL